MNTKERSKRNIQWCLALFTVHRVQTKRCISYTFVRVVAACVYALRYVAFMNEPLHLHVSHVIICMRRLWIPTKKKHKLRKRKKKSLVRVTVETRTIKTHIVTYLSYTLRMLATRRTSSCIHSRFIACINNMFQ